MKTTLIIFLFILAGIQCLGQKYEVWLNQPSNRWIRGQLKSFDETGLNIEKKMKMTLLSSYPITQNATYDWNSTGIIRFRNESRHNAGMLLGTGLGILPGLAIVALSKERKGDFASPVAIPLATALAGMLAGHLLTAAKITIPLHGKSSKEKAEIFRQKLAGDKKNHKN